ncbi:MAG: hypothetical protein KKC51_14395, partial [Verrucomicrobia bacterium]|nr:hypothetical protein [Verrucomicrobiota bacterium]
MPELVRRSGRIALLAVVAAWLTIAPAWAQAAGDAPEGVPAEVWAKIGPQVERQVYAFNRDGAARNAAQEFALAAKAGGLEVNGLLQLRAIALNGVALPDAEPVIAQNRVEYPRGPVTEWFENRKDGVEQGFTIKESKVQGPKSQVSLEVTFGDVRALEIAADGQSARLTDTQGQNFGYAGLKAYDANGQTLKIWLAQSSIGNRQSEIIICVDARGARFPITIDPILTRMQTKLTASDKAANDCFGMSVSVDGDVALVGAQYADPGGLASAGAAYIFERNAGGTNAWGQVAKLTASDKAATNYFGTSVSVAGDVALVGANAADPGGLASAGAAYLFERNAGGTNAWGQVAKLTASDKAAGDVFGYSVSVAGDVALVGARYADPGGVWNAGAAYMFERNAGGTNAWGQVAKLTASDKAVSDYFGTSVSMDGDVALVGAYNASPGGVINAGAAYVFERNAEGTNAWGQVAKLTALDKVAGDWFGISVSVAGDVALVGAYAADPGGLNSAGSAYVFERNASGTNAWGQVAKLTASDKAAGDWFGYSVSMAGDVALVGARYAAPGGVVGAGAAYMFERNAGGTNAWSQVAKLTASDKAAWDLFGHAVSVAGDVVLVGAAYASPGGVSVAGAAYIFPMQYTNWNEKTKLTAPDKATDDYFGGAGCVDGDVAVVGAEEADPGGVASAGAAYVFERKAGGTNAWGYVAKLTASDMTSYDYFGCSVSVAGDVVLVGAYGASPGAVPVAGAAYVFERNAGGTNTWGEVAILTASDKAPSEYFGTSVSVEGDVALVGARYADIGAMTNAGAAYVFERNAGGTNAWGEVAKLTASDNWTNDYFGTSVSVDGDVALVGANYADPGGVSQAGAAYVFERNAGGTNAWGEVVKLTASDKGVADYLGCAVSVDGDVALVGALETDIGGSSRAGAAYIFERNTGGTNAWGEVIKLTASDYYAFNYFGCAVSVSGDNALIGAYGTSPEGTNAAGAVYVFERNAGGTNAWGEVAKLTASDKQEYDWFGRHVVSMDGDVALIGASDADVGGVTNAGAAYIFEALLGTSEMAVLGTNGAEIVNGEAASAAKGTDFGAVGWGRAVTNTFAITNSGNISLFITDMATNGAGAGEFEVRDVPLDVPAGAASNFAVVFTPVLGLSTAVVSLVNTSTNSPFELMLTGSGFPYTTTVVTAYGVASPGSTTTAYGVTLDQWIEGSPLETGGTQYLCTAATVTGNDFTQVTPTNISLTVTNPSVVTWQWTTNVRFTATAGPNGSVTGDPSGWYALGGSVTVTAVPDVTYYFNSWTGNVPAAYTNLNPLTLTMDQARSITALFSTNPPWTATHYAKQDNPGASYPYTSWATAASNIQDAIDAAEAGDTVLVTNGVYNTGGRAGSLSNRVIIAEGVTLESVGGPSVTFIVGEGPCGPSAVRCVKMGTNSMLIGFTLTNGHTWATDTTTTEQSGGGVWCDTGAVVSNCVLTGNRAVYYGGGAYHGLLLDCVFTANECTNYGGGAYRATVVNGVFTGNVSADDGGGAHGGTLAGCVFTGNRAHDKGGGVCSASVTNGVFTGNYCANNGGGAANSLLDTC